MPLDQGKTKQLIDYWTQGSAEDLKNAFEIINQTSRYASGLFFLHLCLEKALKALYVQKKSEHAPFTHNLLGLLEKTEFKLPDADVQILSEINEFNLEARYPDDKFSLYQRATKEVARHYLTECQRLQSWILKTLNKSP
jgi:HEPN domain-containing protein